jgi:hypothetical protein
VPSSQSISRQVFQPYEIGVQFIFWDAYPALQLRDAAANFGIDGLAFGDEPLILFMQHIQSAVNHVIRAVVSAGAQRLRNPVFPFGVSSMVIAGLPLNMARLSVNALIANGFLRYLYED